VSDLIGCELPSPAVTTMLFDIFMKSVHWFMIVFHEPTLRAELEEIMRTGHVQQSKFSLLVLVMVILAIGAKYATKDDVQSCGCPDLDLASLQSNLMRKIEEKLLEVLDQDDIGSVQVCILLSSIYLYHRRPKRCFVVVGAAMKAAQALGLHRESTWGCIDPVEREVRRRVWWALFVCEACVIPLLLACSSLC